MDCSATTNRPIPSLNDFRPMSGHEICELAADWRNALIVPLKGMLRWVATLRASCGRHRGESPLPQKTSGEAVANSTQHRSPSSLRARQLTQVLKTGTFSSSLHGWIHGVLRQLPGARAWAWAWALSLKHLRPRRWPSGQLVHYDSVFWASFGRRRAEGDPPTGCGYRWEAVPTIGAARPYEK